MDLSDLRPNPRAKKKRKRVGRGISAGQGKTAGRGEKGQKHRSKLPPGFEGGQTPLYRRVPTLRGVSKAAHNIGIFRTEYAVVNVGALAERFEADEEVTPQRLLEVGLVGKLLDGVKILGDGEIDKPLKVSAHAFSASAREKIEASGGSVEVIGE
ncbi:MAG: 50S ribosomal protein L15 [Armatimonadota bacterium]|nr:50S ribosomal protein L15 [Armatimonadota bacterium]